MENKNFLNNVKVIDLVQVSLMAALTYIATAVINVPSHMGVVHLGDTMVFLAAVLLGRKKGAASAAIGMCLFDLLSPYAIWAPFTFVIKGIMAYIAGSIAYRANYEGNSFWNNLLGFILGGIWMIGGYYLGGVVISHFYLKMPFNQCFIGSLSDIPGNIAQVVAGTILALPLAKVLKKSIRIK
jgi:uncharacterized membrane protein